MGVRRMGVRRWGGILLVGLGVRRMGDILQVGWVKSPEYQKKGFIATSP